MGQSARGACEQHGRQQGTAQRSEAAPCGGEPRPLYAAVDAAVRLARGEGRGARIERGEYGMCKDCGVRIPLERLSASPTAERCITCQGRFEKTHQHENQPRL